MFFGARLGVPWQAIDGRPLALGRLERSPLQQDGQRLPVGDLGAGLQLGEGAAADGVLDQQEGIAGQAQDTRDVLCRDLERFGAQHHRPLAQLLECNAVVQTAR